MRRILHVDMDAFFASVEQRDDPSLRGRPVIVGGASRRGVVAAASYEVRPYGVFSAMSMVEALRRCPDAVVVPPRHKRYTEVSADVFGVFHRYTPLVEGLSVDEAFLDVTASESLFGDAETIARAIKQAIRDEVGLTASAGVAPCKFAAKIASDLDKPDGLVVVPDGDLPGFLAPLPLERMWGVGPKAAARLRAAGLATFADIAAAPLDRLEPLLGRASALHVQALARGLDDRPVVPGREAESIGAEETFDQDLVDRRALELRLLDLAGRVARRLLESELVATGITLKVKYSDFALKTRSLTLPEPIADTKSLFEAAKVLLDRVAPRPVRLLGIAASSLASAGAAPEPTLFPNDAPERRRRLEAAVLQIEGRFGDKAVRRAALMEGRSGETQQQSPTGRRKG